MPRDAEQRHTITSISEVLATSTVVSDPLFDGPGEMRARCRAFDWSSTPLGTLTEWPQSLRTTVGILLASRNPMFLLNAECSADIVARADGEKLWQVLVNLLSNAVKFTDAGGRVEMTCSADEDTVRVHVRDTGIGIPADKLHVIFDPFVQVRGDFARRHEGTGLGLAISRDLARGMGGRSHGREHAAAGEHVHARAAPRNCRRRLERVRNVP